MKMVKPISDYTESELIEKIDRIKAEREKTATALKRYEKEIVQLKQKLKKAKEALRFYAERTHWGADYTDSFCYMKGWEMAQEYLKEIEE